MRKRILRAFGAIFLILGGAAVWAQTAADIQKFPSCKYCGMDRQKFAHSRMLIDYTDGSALGTCSIHCAAIDLSQSLDKTPKSLQVGDFGSKSLIDAEKAYWVIGGKKDGVMTKRAKWAFAKEGDARQFMKENEGKLANFDDAMKATYEDMYADTKMIRERRAKMKMMQQQKQQTPK
jgi:hypothetical protein